MAARVAVLIGPSGRGSNLRALWQACAEGKVPAGIDLVVSPKEASPAVEWCLEHGLPVCVLPSKTADYAEQLGKALDEDQIEWICLAGYLRLLPIPILRRYPQRVLNIHPALLPKFGGKGMYGLRVHQAVLEAGETESGCTVHWVTEHYDEGTPILQLRCPVLPEDTPEVLAARVLALEHEAYPSALRQVIEDARS